MDLSITLLEKVAGRRLSKAAKVNAASLIEGLAAYGDGIEQPHRLAQFLAQVMHESGSFRSDREIASGEAYEGRKDLGNTKAGDGVRFKGRASIQITGRSNYRQFRDWCRKCGMDPPDFEKQPDAVLTDPWEGLAPIWYWESRNLNRFADQGDIEMLTRKINGGVNGLADRIRLYERAALAILGFAPSAVKAFQGDHGLIADGISGPKTRAAMHRALVAMTPAKARSVAVMAAPVVQKEAVVPKELAKPQTSRFSFWERVGGIGGLSALLTALQGQDYRLVAIIAAALILLLGIGLIFQRQIIQRVKAIKAEIEA